MQWTPMSMTVYRATSRKTPKVLRIAERKKQDNRNKPSPISNQSIHAHPQTSKCISFGDWESTCLCQKLPKTGVAAYSSDISVTTGTWLLPGGQQEAWEAIQGEENWNKLAPRTENRRSWTDRHIHFLLPLLSLTAASHSDNERDVHDAFLLDISQRDEHEDYCVCILRRLYNLDNTHPCTNIHFPPPSNIPLTPSSLPAFPASHWNTVPVYDRSQDAAPRGVLDIALSYGPGVTPSLHKRNPCCPPSYTPVKIRKRDRWTLTGCALMVHEVAMLAASLEGKVIREN